MLFVFKIAKLNVVFFSNSVLCIRLLNEGIKNLFKLLKIKLFWQQREFTIKIKTCVILRFDRLWKVRAYRVLSAGSWLFPVSVKATG